MNVFLDFEASSLSDDSYPIEVGWVFETGEAESHLIKPAPGWTDWSALAETIHKIERHTLLSGGTPHAVVAQRMIDQLTGHALFASAPSWDGKWLSVLLRAAGLPRHVLRLRATDEALKETVRSVLVETVPTSDLEAKVKTVLADAAPKTAPLVLHRALADAEQERQRWLAAREYAAAERDLWR